MTKENEKELWRLCESVRLFLKNNGEPHDVMIITKSSIRLISDKYCQMIEDD